MLKSVHRRIALSGAEAFGQSIMICVLLPIIAKWRRWMRQRMAAAR